MCLISLLERNYISLTRIQMHKECVCVSKPHIPQNQLLQGKQFSFSFAFLSITRPFQRDTILYIATRHKFKDRFSSIAYVLVTIIYDSA